LTSSITTANQRKLTSDVSEEDYSFPHRKWHEEVGREGQNSQVFGSCRPAWQVQQAAEGTGCGYIPAALLCCLSRGKPLGESQAGHGGTGEHIPALTLGTKRTPTLPLMGNTAAG